MALPRRRPSPLARAVLGLTVALLPVFLVATPSLAGTPAAPRAQAPSAAHPVLWSPEPGSTVSGALTRVEVTFDSAVTGRPGRTDGLLLQVIGPGVGKLHFETSCPTVDGRVVSVPVMLGGPGSYRISYQAVSPDGEVTAGEEQFDYEPAGHLAAQDGFPGPVCVDGRVEATSSSPPAPDAGASTEASGTFLGIVGGVVGLALVAMIIVGARSRTRRRP